MALSHLMSCVGCARHVRASEENCPFCGHRLSKAARASAPRPGPRGRLSRAGMYAFGVGSLVVPVALEGCSQSMVSAFYGSTAGLDAMLDMDASGGGDVGVLVAPDGGGVDASGGDGGPDAD